MREKSTIYFLVESFRAGDDACINNILRNYLRKGKIQ
jgi:hypothetical protein